MADGFLRHATEPNAVLGAYADGERLKTDRMRRPRGPAYATTFPGDAWRPGQFHFPPFGSGRHRKDLGDIRSLARSIQEIGLLHPVVIRPDGN